MVQDFVDKAIGLLVDREEETGGLDIALREERGEGEEEGGTPSLPDLAPVSGGATAYSNSIIG